MGLRSFSCICPRARDPSTKTSTKTSKASTPPIHITDSTQSTSPPQTRTIPHSTATTPTLPTPNPPPKPTDTDTASATSSHLTPIQTIAVVLSSIFGTLVSILICRRCWIQWRLRRRRQEREAGGSAGGSGRSSRKSSRRSVWEWVGGGGKDAAKGMAPGDAGGGVGVLGSGFRHRHVEKEAGKVKQG
ncbi:uncharacterized protein AB675_1877 [Cyphellophora attinorum]|uniref:Uncharacterized protein n=1 Tax=Cyphellophora attinorum TaxID=1664694 RepID=A0A0N1H7V1_9EURO|nr:uncharacterized protein AB675_1877 [Phialophora attinorum]KPI42764.1 hypothetical protein AB675_1877 [Phialophora attinorum]